MSRMRRGEAENLYRKEKERQVGGRSREHDRLMAEAKAEFEALMQRDLEYKKNAPAFPIRRDRRKS